MRVESEWKVDGEWMVYVSLCMYPCEVGVKWEEVGGRREEGGERREEEGGWRVEQGDWGAWKMFVLISLY